MFVITENKSICLTRGDVAVIEVNARKNESELYTFAPGDVVRFKVFAKKQCDKIALVVDTVVSEETTSVDILLDSNHTKIGDVINKPVDYWYEIELNPDTHPQTIIGYDSDGPKIFTLYPEGGDA